MTQIISSYHSETDNGYLVIAIALGEWFIYNGVFAKSNVARNLADAVSKAGKINEERWIRNQILERT